MFSGLPGGSVVKNPPAKQEMRVQLLGWEDPLEKDMATHSSILAWKISWTEEPRGLQSMGSQRVRKDLATQQPLGHILDYNWKLTFLFLLQKYCLCFQKLGALGEEQTSQLQETSLTTLPRLPLQVS